MAEEKEKVADQTDAEAEAKAQDAGGASEQEDDLDTLLSQYEEAEEAPSKSKSEQSDSKSDSQPDVNELARQVKEFTEQQNQERFEKDLSQAIETIRGDLPSDVVDDDLVRGWLDARAARDRRLANAWAQRRQDPKGFNKVLKRLNKELSDKFGSLPDKKATEDREAVAAAVRGASKQTSGSDDDIDAKKVAKMSDAQFEQWVAEQARKTG